MSLKRAGVFENEMLKPLTYAVRMICELFEDANSRSVHDTVMTFLLEGASS